MIWSMAATAISAAMTLSPADKLVRMDYPEPTEIRVVVQDVAAWSGRPMVIDSHANGKVQILAPEPLTKEQATERFQAALEQLGLVESEHHGVTQILPKRSVDPASELIRENLEAPDFSDAEDPVPMYFTERTEIRDVVAAVAKWSGRRFVLDRNVNAKVQIFANQPLPRKTAYRVYLAALNLVGLAEQQREVVTQIVPRRILGKEKELRFVTAFPDQPGDVVVNYPDPTDVRTILQEARPWLGHDLILDRNVNGKVQILASDPMTRVEAYKTLVATLDLLGLTMVANGDVVRVVPYRSITAKE